MTDTTDLKKLEKEVFRKFYEDGLFDVFLGAMLAMMPLGSYLEGRMDSEAQILGVLLVVYGVILLVFTLGRKRILTPRLGTFKPAPPRRRKINKVRAALLASVILGAVAFGVSTWVFKGGGGDGARQFVDLIPLVWFVNATGVFAAMAYFLDVPRFYAYGPIFGVAVMLDIYSRTLLDYELSPLAAFGIPAAVVIGVGVYKFVHFLRDYPIRDAGGAFHGS